jgi:hypothetical protein
MGAVPHPPQLFSRTALLRNPPTPQRHPHSRQLSIIITHPPQVSAFQFQKPLRSSASQLPLIPVLLLTKARARLAAHSHTSLPRSSTRRHNLPLVPTIPVSTSDAHAQLPRRRVASQGRGCSMTGMSKDALSVASSCCLGCSIATAIRSGPTP